jgi:dTDP-glucose 4,6-dehydratase
VEDHCRAIEAVLSSDSAGETYNVGGGTERTNVETLRLVASVLDEAFTADPELSRRFPRSPAAQANSSELITNVADRPGHDRRYAMNNRKIELDLGFEPAMTFENGIRNTVAWYLANEEWWREAVVSL